MEVVLGMLFFSLSNANVRFTKRKLVWRRYAMTKALVMKKRVKFVNCKEFTVTALDYKQKTFIVYIALLGVENTVHPFCRA